MKTYLGSLLPKLKRYSARLDDLSLFVDQPWVKVDGNGSRTVYVFRKGGELLIAKNGDVSSGKWSYLDYMDALLLQNSQEEKKLYNCGFLDDAVMALKKDGREEYMLLANENKLEEQTLERVMGRLNQKYLSSPYEEETAPSTNAEKNPEAPAELSQKELAAARREENFIDVALLAVLIAFLALSIILALGFAVLENPS